MKSSMWRQGIALGPCLVVFSSWHTTHPSKYHCSFIYYCCMVPQKQQKGCILILSWSCKNVIWQGLKSKNMPEHHLNEHCCAKHRTSKCFDGDLGHVQLPLQTSYYISLYSWTQSWKVLTCKAFKSSSLISNLLWGW